MSNIIELCTDHTGKMEGIKSLSTSVLLNPNCQKNRVIPGSICSHCYAETLAKMYASLGARLDRNTKELTTRYLTPEDFNYLKEELEKEEIFRFEAFGDLNNEVQLRNYIRICRLFPKIRFSLYTKMYDLVYNYFKTHHGRVPENLNIIISSLKVNTPISAQHFYDLGIFEKGQVKVFTVYDKKFIKSSPELKINCGARSCNTCRICYLKNEILEVNEILKSDRESVKHYFEMKDPVSREKICRNIENLIKTYDMEV